jgi:hypothetical protein
MDIDPYQLLAGLALLLIVTVAFGVRLISKAVRLRRVAAVRTRPTTPTASDYYIRTLRQALEVADGEQNLATALQTTPEDLRRWLAGEEPPPMSVYLAALDLVTHGPDRSETRHLQ